MKLNSKFKNPINLLILLGFICQGFFWENYLMPVLFAGVWFICLNFKKEKQFIHKNFELLIFLFSMVFCLKFIGNNSYFKMLGMGNALLVLQSMRLMWPLDKREKTLSMIISVTMLSVGSQFIIDYSFILILIFSIVLIPKCLFIVASEGFKGVPANHYFAKRKIFYPAITIITILFFIIFPRQKLIPERNTGMLLSGGSMSAQMETVSGGSNLSSKAIFRIKGENIEYLKKFALDTFDGNNWTASKQSYNLKTSFKKENLDKYEYRSVKIMNFGSIRSALPVDGYVIYIKGNFFRGTTGMSAQDNIVIPLRWRESSNEYEYWTSKTKFRALESEELIRYTSYPETSEKLKNWLRNLLGPEQNLKKIAERITSHLRNNFTYNIGVPDLDRSAPVDDFIFNQKEGHCERYASALALLLRMSKIPSRVVIGYHVSPKNQFLDYYTVKAKDAHAWVEAYIKDKGWVIFDATPAGNNPPVEPNPGIMFTIKDWIEYIWYSKIVEFSINDQLSIFSKAKYSIKRILNDLKQKIPWVITLSILIIIGIIAYHFRHFWKSFAFSKKKRVEKQLEAAERFYADLLKALAKVKIYRKAHQTPLELLELIKTAQIRYVDEIELVTQNFCLVKYAEQTLSPIQLKATADAVTKIRYSVKK